MRYHNKMRLTAWKLHCILASIVFLFSLSNVLIVEHLVQNDSQSISIISSEVNGTNNPPSQYVHNSIIDPSFFGIDSNWSSSADVNHHDKTTSQDDHKDTHEVPSDGFSGCLLLKDDNHKLSEWLAYHWLVLPLKYLMVAVDPTGTTSPKHILELWNASDMGMGMEIILWNDADYNHWIDENMDEKHIHRDRQKHFLAECQKYHKRKNRTWVAIIDVDEYMTYNIIQDDDPILIVEEDTPEQFLTLDYVEAMNKTRSHLRQVLEKDKTVFEYINENNQNEPWKSEVCHLMSRLFFSAVDSPTEVLANATISQYGLDPIQFSTLRYFHHAQRGKFDYNHYGKVIVDLSRTHRKEIDRDMYSIHRPNYKTCLVPLKPYVDSILRVHHYLGSWEQYAARDDVRRSKERFEEFGLVNFGTDYQLQHWLRKFVERVGINKSKLLLSHTGVIEKGTKRIIDSEDFIHVDSSVIDSATKKT